MYEVLMEIMEPKIKSREEKLRIEIQEEMRKKVQEEVRKEDLQGTIKALKDLNIENTEIKSVITKAYKLSENEAEEYL